MFKYIDIFNLDLNYKWGRGDSVCAGASKARYTEICLSISYVSIKLK